MSLNLNRHIPLAAVYDRMDRVVERFGSILTAQIHCRPCLSRQEMNQVFQNEFWPDQTSDF